MNTRTERLLSWQSLATLAPALSSAPIVAIWALSPILHLARTYCVLAVAVTGLVSMAGAADYKLKDGTILTGEALGPDVKSVIIKTPDGKLLPRTSWTNFSQDALNEFAKNPKTRRYIEMLIESDSPTVERSTVPRAATAPIVVGRADRERTPRGIPMLPPDPVVIPKTGTDKEIAHSIAEQVRRARWLSVGDSWYTKEWYRSVTGVTERRSATAQPQDIVEWAYFYLQARAMTYSLTENAVSAAERLNGITRRYVTEFTYAVHRRSNGPKSWTEWRNGEAWHDAPTYDKTIVKPPTIYITKKNGEWTTEFKEHRARYDYTSSMDDLVGQKPTMEEISQMPR